MDRVETSRIWTNPIGGYFANPKMVKQIMKTVREEARKEKRLQIAMRRAKCCKCGRAVYFRVSGKWFCEKHYIAYEEKTWIDPKP